MGRRYQRGRLGTLLRLNPGTGGHAALPNSLGAAVPVWWWPVNWIVVPVAFAVIYVQVYWKRKTGRPRREGSETDRGPGLESPRSPDLAYPAGAESRPHCD